MTAPTCLGSLLLALFCAFAALISAGLGWPVTAVILGVAVVFLIALALTYVIPAAVDAALEQEARK